MEQHLPAGCRVKFEDPNALHDFVLAVCPEEGFWQGGKFKFHIKVINIETLIKLVLLYIYELNKI